MAGNRSLDNHVFFNAATTVGTSDLTVTSDASSMNLKFVSTGTFQVRITADISPKNSGAMFSYPCFKYPLYEVVSDVITDASFLYNVDLSAIDYLRVEIIAITGALSIYGKVVG